MKICIYINADKDANGFWQNKFIELISGKAEYQILKSDDLDKIVTADILIVYGGDGTILSTTEFAYKNNLPIIGINAGKIGFLTEYESNETEQAIDDILSGKLISENRFILEIKSKNKKSYALNDAVLQRIYAEVRSSIVTNISVYIDGNYVDNIVGDGVIIATPTGSTGYSLSAGGAILSPGIKAFIMTPISAHSLHHRPVIFSADSKVTLKINGGCPSALFSDGKYQTTKKENEEVFIKKASKTLTFLRRENSNFFKKLNDKLTRNAGEKL